MKADAFGNEALKTPRPERRLLKLWSDTAWLVESHRKAFPGLRK